MGKAEIVVRRARAETVMVNNMVMVGAGEIYTRFDVRMNEEMEY
jgi:hypothetical protein